MTRAAITLTQTHLSDLYAHAREAQPAECCGLISGNSENRARQVYRLRNVARKPLVAYEAAPEDLFEAQRRMRENGDELLAIYHSHPRAIRPQPSETDTRLAYYPAAFYLVIALGSGQPVLGAFRLVEREGRWMQLDYNIVTE